MGQFLPGALRLRLVSLADIFFGCSHRRISLPMTLQEEEGGYHKQLGRPESYVACLDCGRRFIYDWNTMRVTRRELPIVKVVVLLCLLDTNLVRNAGRLSDPTVVSPRFHA